MHPHRPLLRLIKQWTFLFLLATIGLPTATFAAPGAATSQPTSRPASRSAAVVETKLEALLAAKQWNQALAHLKQQKQSAHTLFWRGKTYEFAGQFKQATAAYTKLFTQYPASALAPKARMQAAAAAVKNDNFQVAQALFAKQLTHLLSKENKLALANILLKEANQAAKKKDLTHKRKAVRLGQHIIQLDLPKNTKRKLTLKLVRWMMGHKRFFNRAKLLLDKAYRTYRSSPDAEAFAFLRAQLYAKRWSRYVARGVIQDFIKRFPRSKQLPQALMMLAKTHNVLRFTYNKQSRQRGQSILRDLLSRFPTHPLARQAAFDLAQSQFANRSYKEAIASFRRFLQRSAKEKTDKHRLAAKARYRIATCYQRRKQFKEATKAYQRFLKVHPTDRLWPKAQQNIVTIAYQEAGQYAKQKRWQEAIKAYKGFLRKYPISYRNPYIMRRIGQLYLKQKKPKAAIAAWEQAISKYPRGTQSRKIRWALARAYETYLKDYKQAIKYYKSFRYWRDKRKAKATIRKLKLPLLAMKIPRTFAPKERAYATAFVRNIPSFQARLYLIDAETYFRKMLRFKGMQALDLQLIRPDQTWTVKVQKYQKYHLHQIKIPIPSQKAKVAVLHISGKKKQASAVAVVSSFHIITKANRHALFVYALAQGTHQPLKGVRLLVSNGKKILFEGNTDAKGIFQSQHKGLNSSSHLTILALHKGSAATSHSPLPSSRHKLTPAARGFVFTDRQLYQPGETVQIKGIHTALDKDKALTFSQKPCTVRIFGPGHKLIYKQKQALGPKGSWALSFATASMSPTGRYTIQATTTEGISSTSRFTLKRFRKPLHRISLQLDNKLLQPPQEITGKATVVYGFGVPLRNKKVSIQLHTRGKRHIERFYKTDEQGQISFKLKTSELPLDKRYKVSAAIYPEGTNTTQTLWLRKKAFSLSFHMKRKVFAFGKSIPVVLHAKDLLGRPITTKVALRWATTKKKAGQTKEQPLGKVTHNTNAKGELRFQLKTKHQGTLFLYASAKDKQGNKIERKAALFISGPKDKVILRALAPKRHVHIGETVKVTLLARRSGPALVTFEGETVLSHRFYKKLPKGATTLPLTITKALGPNFALRVVLLHKNKLHTAELPFQVKKHLKINIQSSQKIWRPGAPVTLTLTSRDQAGRPVASALSVSIVRRSLYLLRQDHSSLTRVFSQGSRHTAHTTRASNTYTSIDNKSKRLKQLGLLKNIDSPMANLPGINIGNIGRNNHFGGIQQQVQGIAMGRRVSHSTTQNQGRILAQLADKHTMLAYWNPAITTGPKGQARITFRVPAHLEAGASHWLVKVRAVTTPTLVGQYEKSFTAQAPLHIKWDLPQVASRTDTIIPRLILQSQSRSQQVVTLTLRVGGKTLEQKASVKGHKRAVVSFAPLGLNKGLTQSLTLKLLAKVRAGTKTTTQSSQHTIKLRTARAPFIKTLAGQVRSTYTKVLSPKPGSPKAFQHGLVSVNVGIPAPGWLATWALRLTDKGDDTVGTLAAKAMICEQAYSATKGQKATKALSKKLRLGLALFSRTLWQVQRRDGGWSDQGSTSDPALTAKVLTLLGTLHKQHKLLASKSQLRRARKHLKRAFRDSFSDADKATYLAALASVPARDTEAIYSYSHRLFRSRKGLPYRAVPALAAALLALKRPALAKQLVPNLSRILRVGVVPLPPQASPHSIAASNEVLAHTTALLATLAPKSDVLKAGLKWLHQERQGLRWDTWATSAYAFQALRTHYKGTTKPPKRQELTLSFDRKWKKTFVLTPKQPMLFWQQPVSLGKQAPNVSWSSKSSTPFFFGLTLKGSLDQPLPKVHNQLHRVTRQYRPPYQVVFGLELKPGYTSLRKRRKTKLHNTKRLRVGSYTRVLLTISKRLKGKASVIVDEPLPAGTFVLPSSIKVWGGKATILPGKLRLYLYKNRKRWKLSYKLYATTPGVFQAPPTRLWPVAQPDQQTIGTSHTLRVLPVGASIGKKTHKDTPDELFQAGILYYNKKDWKRAWRYLHPLLEKYELKARPLRRVLKMMLHMAIKRKNADEIVKIFEQRKEQDPDAYLTFEDITHIASAYARRKEYERAMMLYRATLRAHFLSTLKVAQILEKEKEFKVASNFVEGLCLRYPDTNSVQEAMYSLAQTAFQQALAAKKKPKKRKYWLARADQLFRNFISMAPKHKNASTAAYTRANVMLEQKRQAAVIQYLESLGERYTKSDELDSIHYLHAYVLYLRRKSEAARKLLLRVSSKSYLRQNGRKTKSKNRFLATYLIAQIYHANNKLQEALKWYDKIKKKFADAAAQVNYFQTVKLSVPEVTTIKPEATATLKLSHQNIRELTILAYRVDLMKLYTLKKHLNAITKINLAGIKPTYRASQTLSKQHEFAPRKTALSLPLKERGAYLIVLKSKEREVSGILLRTQLMMEVYQEKATGRVTAHVLDVQKRTPVPHTVTRIVGSRESSSHKKKTDLRGIASCKVKGKVTVIAQRGDDFAFFRGKISLSPPLPRPRSRWRRRWRRRWKQRLRRFKSKKKAPGMLDNIQEDNYFNSQDGRKRMRKLYDQSRNSGVQMKSFW